MQNLEILLNKVFVALNQSNKTTWMYKDVERMHDKLKTNVRQSLNLRNISNTSFKQNTFTLYR